jgi:outer membrane protein OmpA-like peptidoglycan-associated protein
MTMIAARRATTVAATFLAGVLTLSAGVGPALAQAPLTEGQILEALKPRITRSLTGAPADTARTVEDRHVIDDALHQSQTRSLSSTQRDQVAAIAKDKPKIDLEIYFDYKSAAISPRAVPDLTTLGKALSNPDLGGSVFMIAGHTDAKGGERYNLSLSEQRAEAVKRYLIQKFGFSADALMSVGYGKEHLKNTNDPYAAENRRVQVVNMGAKSTASK